VSNLTTLTLSEEQLERLKAYRHSDHDSWVQTVEDILRVLPDAEDVYEEGCMVCGKTAIGTDPIADAGGFTRWFHHEVSGEDLFHTHYFCSAECIEEQAEREEKAVPSSPDEVVVGGANELRVSVSDASFHMSGTEKSVGINIPGAFGGESSHGRKYAYTGEPVYIIKDDKVRQSGIIRDIIHEETWTGITLARDASPASFTRLELNHPDEEVRESFCNENPSRREATCPECDDQLRWVEADNELPVQCPTCWAEVDA
jgi:hypothetical protein